MPLFHSCMVFPAKILCQRRSITAKNVLIVTSFLQVDTNVFNDEKKMSRKCKMSQKKTKKKKKKTMAYL